MPRFVPGDQCYVRVGARLCAVIGNEECWNDSCRQGIVVGTSVHVVEEDDGVTARVMVMLPNRGLFMVEESNLWTPDEYGNPTLLFPLTRLQEP